MSNVRSTIAKFGRISKALLRDPSVSSHAKVAYAVLDEVAGYEDVTMALLAEWMGVSRDTARRAIYELRDHGWIEVIEQTSDGRKVENAYVVHGAPVRIDGAPVPHTRGTSAPSGWGTRAPSTTYETNETSETNTTGAVAPVRGDDLRGFEEFWKAFPTVRGSKADARKAWKTSKAAKHAEAVAAAAARFRDDPNRQDAYTPGAGVWLRREGWTEPPLPARVSNRPSVDDRVRDGMALSQRLRSEEDPWETAGLIEGGAR